MRDQNAESLGFVLVSGGGCILKELLERAAIFLISAATLVAGIVPIFIAWHFIAKYR